MKLKEEYKDFQDLFNQGYRFDPENEVFFCLDMKKFSLPTDSKYSEWKVKQFKQDEYLTQRMEELEIPFVIELLDSKGNIYNGQVYKAKDKKQPYKAKEIVPGSYFDENSEPLKTRLIYAPAHLLLDKEKGVHPIFTSNQYGDIEILRYNLKRQIIQREKKTTSAGTSFAVSVRKRLNPLYAEICEGKYDASEDVNAPFWHPRLIEAFENEEPIETLTITEGPIKAYKATQDGILTVGLNSINAFKDKKTGEFHTEILEFIHKCNVKNVIILWDGDCIHISDKHLESKQDLSQRPSLFFAFARWIRESIYKTNSSKKLSVFHATIRTADIDSNPKGIDDLLCIKSIPNTDIKVDFDRIGKIPGYYITWINITTDGGVKELRSFYLLDSPHKFYQFHAEKIKGRQFIFQRNTYKVVNGMPVMEVSADLKEYKLIGNDFYREVDCTVPTGKKGEWTTEKRLKGWKADIIKLVHGKDALHKIEKFKGFTNIPSHIDYQQVINEEWNLYANVKHEKREGDFPTIKQLLKHLFQEHYDNEMIFDYITILYKYPMQKLPIICLLSEEQGTGKSTFLFLLKLIFKQNMAIVSNADITSEFNAHWTSKLIAACEETIFDKKDAYEKLKAYTTQKSIIRNDKNKSQEEVPCMLHFVLCSNHENDFMKISKYDRRLWVRKISPFKKKEADADITFDDRLEAEIPAFVHYIENREVKYKERGELFFHQTDFQTKAFFNLVDNSEPNLVKELKEAFAENFLKYGGDTIEMTAKDIIAHFGVKAEKTYLDKTIKFWFKAERVKNKKGQEYVRPYQFTVDDPADPAGTGKIIRGKGRPFVFRYDMFFKEHEIQTVMDFTEKEDKKDIPF